MYSTTVTIKMDPLISPKKGDIRQAGIYLVADEKNRQWYHVFNGKTMGVGWHDRWAAFNHLGCVLNKPMPDDAVLAGALNFEHEIAKLKKRNAGSYP